MGINWNTRTADLLADVKSVRGGNGVQASIKTLGCLSKGDRGHGEYKWNETSTDADNGVTVIQPIIGGTPLATGRWELQHNGAISVKQAGVVGDGSTDDNPALQNLIDVVSGIGGGTITIPKGNYYTISSAPVVVGSNVIIRGETGGITKFIKTTSGGTNPFFRIQGDNVLIDGVLFSCPNAVQGFAHIEVNYGQNIRIVGCYSDTGYKGIQLKPGNNETIRNVSILDCFFNQITAPVMIGTDTTDPAVTGDLVENVIIHGCYMGNGKFLQAGGDGIKTTRKCNNLIITSNHISGMTRDAIDLFASGDRVIITSNCFVNNTIKGLDIKSNTTDYPESVYGNNGRFMIISDNLFDGNQSSGISILRAVDNGNYNYGISISNNIFRNHPLQPITANCKDLSIINNKFVGNCFASDPTNPDVGIAHVIDLGNNTANQACHYATISGNTFTNNGAGVLNSGTGVYTSKYAVYMVYVPNSAKCISITDNKVINNTELPNYATFYGFYVNATATNVKFSGNQFDSNYSDSTGDLVLNGFVNNYQIISGADVEFSQRTVFNTGSIVSTSVTSSYLDTNYPLAFYPLNTKVVFTNLSDNSAMTIEALRCRTSSGYRWFIKKDPVTIDASQIVSSVISTSRLATGTASAGTVLRGDGTWANNISGAFSFAGRLTAISTVSQVRAAYDGSHYLDILTASDGTATISTTPNMPINFTPQVNLNGGVKVTVGSDATGDMYYRNSSGLLARIAAGSNGQTLNWTGGVPVWGTPFTPAELSGTIYGDGTMSSFPTGVSNIILTPTANNTIDLSTGATYIGAAGRIVQILNTTNYTYQIHGVTISNKFVWVVWTATNTPSFINL